MYNQESNSTYPCIENTEDSGNSGTFLRSSMKTTQKTVWIDLDNSPHVPFFAPIIKELENRGHTVFLTARDFAQVTELAKLMHLRCVTIGRHYGKNILVKLAGVAIRAGQL